ncbi:hypothetical protein ACFWCB_23970 [Streptomyces sp. NPDC060048]|uniref:hypothetical protein n=1 Tax=unclassified Streptomyces TaxID=2593676 RepID=UPI0036BC1274
MKPEPSQPDPSHGTPMSEAGRGQSELADLHRRIAELEGGGRPTHHRWRSALSAVLVILAAFLSVLSVVAVWTNSMVEDTDRYVDTVAPLAQDPAVQTAVTNRATTVILEKIDVKELVGELSAAAKQEGAPPAAAKLIGQLSGPIENGLKELVNSTVRRIVSSSAFETLWTDANRVAHRSLDKALTGEGGGAVTLKGDQVAIDVGPIIDRAKDELVKSGFERAASIPEVHTDFVVFSSDELAKVKTYTRILQILGSWLPVVTVLIAAAAVFLAAHRRRVLVTTALAVAFGMLVLGVSLTVFRGIYLDRLPPEVSQDAAAAVFDALVKFLRATIRAVAAVALVTACAAFLTGPSRAAVTIRQACSGGIGSVRSAAASGGLHLGGVGRFVHRHKRWIGGLILLVALIVLVTWSYPSTAVVLWIVVAVLAAFAVREFLDDDAGAADTAGPYGGGKEPRAS